MELPLFKDCTRCRKNLPRDEYYRSQYSRTGLYSHCKTCHRALLRSKRKRVADAKAMARQPLPPIATDLGGPVGLISTLPQQKVNMKRVMAFFDQAFDQVGVSRALMVRGMLPRERMR